MKNSKAIFWKNGEPLKKGDRLVQKNLGKSLELIAEHGPEAFYKGAIADQIADEMKKHGGLITKADLASYKAVERTPVSGEYRGYEVYSMPPPSSGGIHIVQILNILEKLRYAEIWLWQRRCYAGDGGGGETRLCRPL